MNWYDHCWGMQEAVLRLRSVLRPMPYNWPTSHLELGEINEVAVFAGGTEMVYEPRIWDHLVKLHGVRFGTDKRKGLITQHANDGTFYHRERDGPDLDASWTIRPTVPASQGGPVSGKRAAAARRLLGLACGFPEVSVWPPWDTGTPKDRERHVTRTELVWNGLWRWRWVAGAHVPGGRQLPQVRCSSPCAAGNLRSPEGGWPMFAGAALTRPLQIGKRALSGLSRVTSGP
ncbi:uncharacterized protein LOC123033620 [Varanus komodoensis]|uniref:uncharacterized protein LOC123033620 n=1 Tax=Varanus komodoensis TaxID=61221 RepID=UPI001CF7EC3D|nr:uncharacterized protein LOC123033620 [Varanus komodoensis]